uniref:ABC transporter transmembrane domain-containing protein n=1 Tax=Thaumasiovibrio occultus TaxID=1891184 RepID=UPI000B35C19E|nr:ABC transporter transmembrane domain-containing protein [Thaumasiovibrio occultus]
MSAPLIPKIHWFDTLYIIVSTLVTTLIGLVLPFSILIIFDRILPNQSTNSLMLIYLIILGSIVLDYFIKKSEESLVAKIAAKTEHRLISRLFNAICNTDIAKYRQYNIGSLLERVSAVPEIKDFYSGESIKAWINLFTSFVTILLIYLINPAAGWVLIGASLILLVVSLYLSRKRVTLIATRNDIESEANSRVIEIVSNPLMIKARAMEYRIENYMDVIVEDRENKSVEFESIDASFNLILGFIQTMSVAVVVVVCALATINLEISQGIMAAIIMLTNRYFSPYQQVMRYLGRLKMIKQRLQTIVEIVDLEIEKDGSEPLHHIHSVQVISDYVMTFNPGKVHILTGPSSSGKTLISKHLSMDISSDYFDIRVNDKEIHRYQYQTIKQTVIRIDKDSEFIEGSIIDNLTSFRPELNRSAMSLCESLGIRPTIDELKDGFYTGLSSTTLIPFSRQVLFTLLIIRALLSTKNIIIIDDLDLVHDPKLEQLLLDVCIPRCQSKCFILASNKIQREENTIQRHPISVEIPL